MRFLVDEQLPPALAEWLRSRGHEAAHVREVGLQSAPDAAVLEHARRTAAVIKLATVPTLVGELMMLAENPGKRVVELRRPARRRAGADARA